MDTHPAQPPLPMDLPLPDLDDPAVLAAARRIYEQRPYWHRTYPSLEAALADAQRRRLLLICARRAWLARAARRR
jgi:hypothetical protein